MTAPRAKYIQILSDINRFSTCILKMPLYDYQLHPLQTILHSILHNHGREHLLVFSRQSGKNEAIAHLLVYLLNIYQRQGGNIVFAAIGDGLGRGRKRLLDRLNNPWNRDQWRKAQNPNRILLGNVAVVFISSHPQSAARGETADHLLVIDELQDQDPLHLEATFTPMRAANNATAVYLGTVRSRYDALWQKKEQLQRLQNKDNRQRVFWAGPERVTASNSNYANFLQSQVAQYGRFHPIIASEYFLEPLETAGGLFPPRRLRLMQGQHPRQRTPTGAGPYIALLDVGGQDEAATEPLQQLANPARDYTVCTIAQIIQPADSAEPTYHALDVFVDHGSRHFSSNHAGDSLAYRLLTYLQSWSIIHLVADAGGVGEGLVDWLAARLGPHNVNPYKFTRATKAALGASFLALIETGRFKYWIDDKDQISSDGWWFWQQAAHCIYELPPGGLLDRHLTWHVPPTAKISTPSGPQPVHDDRLISAALIAEADRLIREGKILTGHAHSAIIDHYDPISHLPDW